MKIFISWSGTESKEISLVLRSWLKKVLQATDPWMSDIDIHPGTRWSERIAAELRKSSFGIICVTPQNRSSEWINFEAGALSMAMDDLERKVVPLLVGFEERGELNRGPMGLFNAVRLVQEDMWKLVLTINAELESSVEGEDLREIFDMFWPALEKEVGEIRKSAAEPAPPKPTQDEQLAEILETVIGIRKQLRGKTNSRTWNEVVGRPHTPPSGPPTAREREVLKLIIQGSSNEEISRELSLSVRTVEGHAYSLMSKAQVSTREELREISPYFDLDPNG